jgi:molecular chaperone DnaK (HSP70)
MIGIDLGTTYSCVAVWENGQVQIITNSQGNRTTPSYLLINEEGERIVGDAAKNSASKESNIGRTLYDVKRIIGKKYSDPKVKEDIKHF